MHSDAISRYYGRPDLSASILAALRRAGKDVDALDRHDLAAFDEFHIGGRTVTMELAKTAGVHEGMVVLDVGCGIGGPARALAAEFACRVTGLDLTQEYCRAAEMLNERVGLAADVAVRQGDALEMPLEDETFDLAWMQHTSMNIEDKICLFEEIHRVLRPGGRLALHEVFAGSTVPLRFPVPWADGPAISFLVTPAEARRLLAAAGFRELLWSDVTAPSIEWFQRARAPASPLGLHLLINDIAEKSANVLRNLEEDRIAVVQAVLERI